MPVSCYYTNDKKAGRVLIPGCWAAAIHGKEFCTCKPGQPTRVDLLEKRIEKLEKIIKQYEKK